MLAYLNSSFVKLYIESYGRVAGGVAALALEVEAARNIPIIDVKRLSEDVIKKLADLFNELEAEAKKLGGADTVENVYGSELARELTGKEVKQSIAGLFNTVIKKIDYEVARILGLENLVEVVRTLVIEMARRRLSRAGGAKLTALKGSEPLVESKTTKRRKKSRSSSSSSSPQSMTLDKWLKPR